MFADKLERNTSCFEIAFFTRINIGIVVRYEATQLQVEGVYDWAAGLIQTTMALVTLEQRQRIVRLVESIRNR